jgi:lipid-A-disaccharide synthase
MSTPLIFLVAGEPSGDALGARLMAALKVERDGDVAFAGVGGPEMEAEGLVSLFPMGDLSIMGLFEVLPRLRTVFARLKQTVSAVQSLKPDLVITIDAQAFSYRVAKRLIPAPCPVIHYVAPTVWAWKPWRARKVAQVVDRLLLLFPFEKPFWDAVDQDSTFVGHPIAESPVGDPGTWRGTCLGEQDGPLLALLPGSRRSEVSRHLPLFRATLERLNHDHSGMALVIPTVANVADMVRSGVENWPWPVTVVEGDGEVRRLAMAAADAAIAVSGTVALDLAAAGTPHVIAYKANPFTIAIVRHMLKIRYVSLVNLIADEEVTPELLQEHCTPESLSDAVGRLLVSPEAASRQRQAMENVMNQLGSPEDPPSRKAARAALGLLTAPTG